MKKSDEFKLLLFISLMLISLISNAQRRNLRPPIMKLKDLAGVEFAKEACKVAENSMYNNQLEKAFNLARRAYEEAEADNSKEWMGVSLQIEGGAKYLMIVNTVMKDKDKLEVRSLLTRSSVLLKGTPSENRIKLNIEWLQHLDKGTTPELPQGRFKNLAQLKNKIGNKGVDSLTREDIQKLNPAARRTFDKIMEQRETRKITQAQIEDLKDKLNKTRDLSETQKKHMEAQLLEQNKLVEGLNVEQARAELLLSRQRGILDSMIFVGTLDSIKLANQQNVLTQQKTELDLQHSQRNLAIAGGGILALLAIGVFLRFKSEKKYSAALSEKNKIIESEKAKSDKLLLNILPQAVADDLKEHGIARTRNYEKVTILFTDFVNFTTISSQMSPEELVQNLDYCFKHFDAIVRKYGIEKIKTIGDSYMAAGGLPDPDKDHPMKMIQVAKEMQSFLADWKQEKIKVNKPWFEARIGLHTGPVTAGIVGMDKFAYDIWGDTVNVASRMESSSEPGRINISESLYQMVKSNVNCTFRGKLPAKNKGEIEMYFVE